MSGPNAIRGFNFQHARALHAALDLLENSDLSVLAVEGDDDVVDYELLDASGQRVHVAQIKSRTKPPWWVPGEILTVINRWSELPDADGAEFQFISDGAAGPEVARHLLPALQRLREGKAKDEDVRYLEGKGLSERPELLARTRVELQQPPVGAALDQADMRVLRLLQGRRPVTADDASAIVNRLFREISVMGGEGDRQARRVDRAQLAALLEVDLTDLDAREAWGETVAERVRQAIGSRPRADALADMGLAPVEQSAPALALLAGEANSTREEAAESLDALLQEQRGAGLTGSSGAGKSTALEQLATLAALQARVPAFPDTTGYTAGSLFRLLWQALQDMSGVMLSRGAVEGWLASGQAVVMLDGVTERPAGETAALLADLRSLRREWPATQVFACGRDEALLGGLDLPVYMLQGLGSEEQERIATELLGEQAGRVTLHRLARTLGDALANPLLLRMALALAAAGVQPDSHAGLYEGILDGLIARANPAPGEASVSALALCSMELVSEQRFAADGHWWRAQLRAALDHLADLGLFDTAELAANTALSELLDFGLLTRAGAFGEIRYLHDSFRDFMGARAVSHEAAQIPVPLDERYEAFAEFLGELAAPTVELLRRLCDNPVAASRACRLDPMPPAVEPIDLAQQLFDQLMRTHGLGSGPARDGLQLRGWRSHRRLYVALMPPAAKASLLGDAEQFEADLAAAAVILTLDPASGSLRIALTLWQELLRADLEALSQRGRPLAIPSETDAVAVAVAEHFTSARAHMQRIANEMCSTLAERIVLAVGWDGLRATVGAKTEETPFAPAMHGLLFTYDDDRVLVTVGDLPADERGWTRTSAELYLHPAPHEAAVTAVEQAMKRLLETWGP